MDARAEQSAVALAYAWAGDVIALDGGGPTIELGPDDGALGPRLFALAPGTTVRLRPGVYPGPLACDRDLAIVAAQGLGSVTLLGGRGPTISIEGARRVLLRNLVLRGAQPAGGACLQQYMEADVVVQGCLLHDGRGRGEGGGGVDLQRGRLLLQRCRVVRNRAPQGGGLRAAGPAWATLEDCIVADNRADGVGGGGIFASRGARVDVRRCTFAGNFGARGAALLAGGGAGGGGAVAVDASLFAHDSDGLLAHQSGSLRIERSLVPRPLRSEEGLHVGAGVTVRAIELDRQGSRPFRPRVVALAAAANAPAHGATGADAADEGPGDLDVYGNRRDVLWIGAVA